MPSDVAKIIAVKKSRKDFTMRISKLPLIPSFIAPKIPVPLNENKTTIATNLDKNSSWLFMLLGLSGNIFSTRPFADDASLLIPRSNKSNYPIIVPNNTDKIIAGILVVFATITMPMPIEHRPKIKVKLVRKRSGMRPPSAAPITAPPIIASALI